VNDIIASIAATGRVTVAGAPEGVDALVLARRALAGPVLHIARDDARMAELAELAAFFAPGLDIIAMPAWDCLPYDRVSPNREIAARRIDALTRLAGAQPGAPRLIITTVNAALQRVPPREAFAGRVFEAKAGARIDQAALIAFLNDNGYARTDIVDEPGEYAVRGGILDLFPPGAEEPLRLDFFGDEIEAIRLFDPLTQRSGERIDAVTLKPVSEVLIDAAAIERFRTGYRALFGAVTGSDPLYEAVSAGRLYAGMEHWLPLFLPRMETLFDYAPDCAITLDDQADAARLARLDAIKDFHQARLDLRRAEARGGAPVYNPLPPDRLYLTDAEWQARLRGRTIATFSPFAASEIQGEEQGIDAGGRRARDFGDIRTQPGLNLFEGVRDRVAAELGQGRRVLVAGYSAGSLDRLAHLLAEHGLTRQQPIAAWAELERLPEGTAGFAVLPLEHGFEYDGAIVHSEQDILGERLARPQRKKRRADRFLAELSTLTEGDLVVHVEHGIGRYDGLATLDVGGAPHDCLRLIYEGNDKLFVPVENLDVLTRFGSEDASVPLDRLGGAGWQSRKARIKQRIRLIAAELIKLAAERRLKPGIAMEPPDGAFDEFCARFPYPETDDQIRAIADVLEDMASGRPMDRLICGDVGFGKTEVALRAAFVAAMSGHQVAVVTPTTLLARQHFQTFSERFKGLPVRIGVLSRLVPPRETAETKKALAEGKIEIAIGTHALLGRSISFANLGLLIVDEEQHFGVKQKERLKRLRAEVHVLTLTATPIPRTLQMALSGVREMSLIATPPVDRLAVRTFVLPYDPLVIREAIMREHYRGGQTFYVCPRIEDLPKLADRLRDLVPEIKFVTAHGQMAAGRLEEAMTAFYEGGYNLLLSTNIIESGLDIPTANTIVIDRADMFGLAQLYQLRGRIGRSKLRGYAYLTLPADRALNPVAQRRLEVMQSLDTLGAGFTLASHDLDIRGAGNLLGDEQSGHIKEVGIELYQQMLEDAVEEARGVAAPAAEEGWTPQIAVGMPVLIPEDYVPDLTVRLGLYRRIAALVDRAEIDGFAAELIDRFGPLPPEVENLLRIVAIKRLCREAGVEKVEAGPKGAVVSFHKNNFAKPEKLIALIGRERKRFSVRPDQKLVLHSAWETPQARVEGVHALMQELAKLAA
jgi:transcription-repair coupling factor (superfamily II helicase)